MMRLIATATIIVQSLLAARFFRTLARTRSGDRIPAADAALIEEPIAVIVPVLNEVRRLEPCLAALADQPDTTREILVVDGGSEDGTRELVRRWESVDSRMRLINADSVAKGWNGKAWGLQSGLDHLTDDAAWVVTVDADVRCRPGALDAAVGYAAGHGLPVLSVAALQRAGTPGLSLVHPSLLATLVYRFGAPGHTAQSVDEVQANGQFGVYRRDALERAGGFVVARDSICEDVTLARHLYLLGNEVGFFEAEDLAVTEMHADGWEALSNWPRSLSLRDRIRPNAGIAGLLSTFFLQTLPLIVTLGAVLSRGRAGAGVLLNRVLLMSRICVAAGTRRAYVEAHPIYWASPLFDPVTLLSYLGHLVRRRRVWRGRELVQDG